MRLEIDVGLYHTDLATILKWYQLAFKNKHENKEDERLFQKLTVLYEDMLREDAEENEIESD